MKDFIRNMLHFITRIVSLVMAIAAIHYKLLYKKVRKREANKNTKRSSLYYTITTQWVLNKQAGKTMKSFLKENNIYKIAVYGMGTMEELLYGEIKNLDVTICYRIDKNASKYAFMLDVITMDEIVDCEKVDAIIVTPVFAFETIAEDLKKYTDAQIISLEELVYAME